MLLNKYRWQEPALANILFVFDSVVWHAAQLIT